MQDAAYNFCFPMQIQLIYQVSSGFFADIPFFHDSPVRHLSSPCTLIFSGVMGSSHLFHRPFLGRLAVPLPFSPKIYKKVPKFFHFHYQSPTKDIVCIPSWPPTYKKVHCFRLFQTLSHHYLLLHGKS